MTSNIELLTVSKITGLHKVMRFPSGVVAAPGMLRRFMENKLSRLPRVSAYLDDVIVCGVTKLVHRERLTNVLQRLVQANLRLNNAKGRFSVVGVHFLGHPNDAEGVHTTEDMVQAIVREPAPTSKQTLQ